MLGCDQGVSGVHALDGRLRLLPHAVHLDGDLAHEGIELLQQVVALVEERELRVHERDELWAGGGEGS